MSTKNNAIVTASYSPDFERCRVLCETIDTHVTGFTKHYIVVSNDDVTLFDALEGPNRVILSDKDLLPWWLMRVPGAIAPGGKPAWLSPITMPLHGWHVQQLRRIAIAHYVSDDALFYCDSDTAFIRPFDLNDLWRGNALRLYREAGTASAALSDHLLWLGHAALTLRHDEINQINDNYVGTFIAWRRDVVIAMCDRIATVHRRPWIGPIGRSRKFSECTLYGAFADTLADPALHWHDDKGLCPMHWFDPAPKAAELDQMVASLAPHEVGFGVQSFVPIEHETFRSIALKPRTTPAVPR